MKNILPILIERTAAQAVAALMVDDREALQRFLDKGERLHSMEVLQTGKNSLVLKGACELPKEDSAKLRRVNKQ